MSFLDWLFGNNLPDIETSVDKERKRFWAVQHALNGPYGDNTALYAQTAKLVSVANFPTANKFAAGLMLQFLDRCDELNIPHPQYDIAVHMIGAAAGLYAAERLTDLPPNPAHYGSHAYNAAVGTMRDLLLRQQIKAADPSATLHTLSTTIIASFIATARHLPSLAHDEDIDTSSAMSIPLIAILPNVGLIIEHALEPFGSSDAKQFRLFSWLHGKLKDNTDRLAEKLHSTRPTLPTQFKGSPIEIVTAYLKDTPLEPIFLETRVPFQIPQETRFSGHWIVAPPGRGKTTLLHSMFLEDIKREASIIVCDSKGDLINPLKQLKSIEDRLLLIEPDAHYPLALNPLDVQSANIPHAIALIEYILSGLLDAKFTNLQSALFRHVLPAILQAIPSPTIETLKLVLANGLTSEQIVKLDDRLKVFFTDKINGFYSKTYAETRSQIVWRLDFILTNDTMRAMFASPITRLKMADAMNSGKIIVIDASKAILGDDGSEFYQRFFLALILGAAQARSALKPAQKLPVFCYLDECQFCRNDTKLALILDECRSQKIALILAHQRTDQIKDANVLSAMANCAIRFANSDDEAKYLAPKLRCDPEFLHSLPRGTFAAYVRDYTTTALALQIPYHDMSKLPCMTAEEQAALRDKMRAQYSNLFTTTGKKSETQNAPSKDEALSVTATVLSETNAPIIPPPPPPATPPKKIKRW